MRIEELSSAVPRTGSYSSRSKQAEFTLPDTASSPPAEDIVQLTLSHEGIWEVSGPSPSSDGNLAAAAHTAPLPMPRVARLYHSLLRLYSPEGLLQAFEHSRGLVVDLYV